MTSNHDGFTGDKLVRQALELQASRAVDPERIIAALPVRAARRRRNRRVGAVATLAAAIAAAGATAVPTLLMGGSEGGMDQSGSAPPARVLTSPRSPVGVTPIAVPLRFRPTWMPPGYAELSRNAPSDTTGRAVGRLWSNRPWASLDSGGPRIYLNVHAETDIGKLVGAGTEVDVNGRRGVFLNADGDPTGKSSMAWEAEDGTVLQVSQYETGLSKTDMIKIARSVQPDSAVLSMPLRVGWLPAGLSGVGAQFGGDSAASWKASITVADSGRGSDEGTKRSPTAGAKRSPSAGAERSPSAGAERSPSAGAERSPSAGAERSPTAGAETPPGAETRSKPAGDERSRSGAPPRFGTIGIGPRGSGLGAGEQLTVGGHAARLVTRTSGSDTYRDLIVEVDQDLALTVSFVDSVSREDLVKIAESAEVEGQFDPSWIGRPVG